MGVPNDIDIITRDEKRVWVSLFKFEVHLITHKVLADEAFEAVMRQGYLIVERPLSQGSGQDVITEFGLEGNPLGHLHGIDRQEIERLFWKLPLPQLLGMVP